MALLLKNRIETLRLASTRARGVAVVKCQASADHKRATAAFFVDKYVNSNQVLGLGSGELVNLVIAEVGSRLLAGKLENVVGYPACDVAAPEAAFHGLPLMSVEEEVKVDLAFDEVDQIDIGQRAYLKGQSSHPQHPQLTRMLSTARNAKRFIVLADQSDVVQRLNGSLPVMVDASEWEETAEELDDIFLGDAELWRRPTVPGESDPRGGDHPYITPDGCNIVDVKFYEGLKLYGEDAPYIKIADEISNVPGVVAHGLVIGMAEAAVIAKSEGEPQVVDFSV